MAAVLEQHMDGRQFLVGDDVTVPDFVAAYTLDMAAVLEKHGLLDNLPRLRGFLERMYKRPNAPPRLPWPPCHRQASPPDRSLPGSAVMSALGALTFSISTGSARSSK